MKKIVVLLFALIGIEANAQKLIGGDHILKTNLSSDALKNYNLTFEKNILPFVSLSASYRTMPKTALPLKSLAKQFIKSDDINFDNFVIFASGVSNSKETNPAQFQREFDLLEDTIMTVFRILSRMGMMN